MQKRNIRGFSLAELLVVIAIVATLAAMLFPVMSSAKRSAKVETSKQYLKQQLMLVLLYTEDRDGQFPLYTGLRADAKYLAPKSPLDDWKTPIKERVAPMIGSFAYGPSLADDLLSDTISWSPPSPVLADIFTAEYRVNEFSGTEPADFHDCLRRFTCEIPERIWYAYSDGSLRVHRCPVPLTSFPTSGVAPARKLFTWPTIFDLELKKVPKG